MPSAQESVKPMKIRLTATEAANQGKRLGSRVRRVAMLKEDIVRARDHRQAMWPCREIGSRNTEPETDSESDGGRQGGKGEPRRRNGENRRQAVEEAALWRQVADVAKEIGR